ncbi:MAG: YeeE/YedE family protein [Enterococcus sp.]
MKQYFNEHNLNVKQPIIAIIVLLLTIPFAFFTASRVATLPVWLLAGLALGYIFTRSRFGFAGGIKKLFYAGNSQLAISLLLLLGVTAILTTGIQWSAAGTGAVSATVAKAGQAIIPGSNYVEFTNVSTILGGALFGAGMILAGGCASGTLTDLGEGQGHAFVAFPFFVLSSPLGVYLGAQLDASPLGQIGGSVYLPDSFGYLGSFGILLVFLGVLYAIIRWYQNRRVKNGKYNVQKEIYETFEQPLTSSDNQVSLYHKVFIERWSFKTAAFLTTIVAGFILITTGVPWGVTSAFTLLGFQIFDALGVPFNGPEFANWTAQLDAGGVLSNGTAIRNIGIVIGSLVAFLFAGRFRFNFKFSGKDAGIYALGGTLMGVGARLAKGCNIGALYSGITNHSLHGYVFLIALTFGSVLALVVLEGKTAILPQRSTFNEAIEELN